jgi:hypothetical protein
MSPHTIGTTSFDNSDINLTYGSIFGGGDTEGKGIFLLQKRVVQNIRGVGKKTYCMQIFRDLNMLPKVGITYHFISFHITNK